MQRVTECGLHGPMISRQLHCLGLQLMRDGNATVLTLREGEWRFPLPGSRRDPVRPGLAWAKLYVERFVGQRHALVSEPTAEVYAPSPGSLDQAGDVCVGSKVSNPNHASVFRVGESPPFPRQLALYAVFGMLRTTRMES